MKREKENPRYADCFCEYSIAVALLGELCKEGVLPKETFEKIKTGFQKDIEKYRIMCYDDRRNDIDGGNSGGF